MIRDNIVGERNCTVSSFLGRGEEWKEEEIEAVGKYVFKNSRYQAWNGDNIPSGSSRKGTQTREKEFGWNSTVRLVVDSLVSRGNWPELFNGAPSLKFSLHRLLMDVICVLRVPVIYSNLIHRVENEWIRTLYVIRGGINNLIIILIILQMNTNLFCRGYFKRYLNKFNFFFIHSIRIPSISFAFAFKSNGTFYR